MQEWHLLTHCPASHHASHACLCHWCQNVVTRTLLMCTPRSPTCRPREAWEEDSYRRNLGSFQRQSPLDVRCQCLSTIAREAREHFVRWRTTLCTR